jgi:RNA polymerase primary sigma factor
MDTRSQQIYSKEINKLKPLPAAKEKQLADRIQKGDKKALNQLVKANLRFVRGIAMKYQGRNVPVDDLVAEGNRGLIEAAKRFKSDRNLKFISYAVWWVRMFVLNAVARQCHVVTTQPYTYNEINNVIRAIADLEQKHGRDVDVVDVTEHLKLPKSTVIQAIGVRSGMESIDTVTNDYLTRGYPADTQVVPNNLKKVVHEHLKMLPERQQIVVEKLFGLSGAPPVPLTDVSPLVGLTSERVRQLKVMALETLRKKPILKEYANDL